MTVATILLGLTSVLLASLGLVVWRRQPGRTLNRLFFALTIAIATWSITNGLFTSLSGRAEYIDALLSYGAASMAAALFYAFSISLTKRKRGDRLSTVISLGVLATILSCIPYVLATGVQDKQIITTPAIILYALFLVASLGLGLRRLIVSRKKAVGLRRTQIQAVLIGLAVAITGGVIFNLVLPVIFNQYSLVQYGPVFSLFFIATSSYAIIRHHLFDIRRTAARLLAYVLSVGVLGIVFGLGMTSFLEAFGASRITLSAAAITVAIGTAITFPVVKQLFDRLTRSIFFQNVYDSQEVIDEMTNIFVGINEKRKLIETTTERLAARLGATKVSVVLKKEKKHSFDDLPQKTLEFMDRKKLTQLAIDEIDDQNQAVLDELVENDIALLVELRVRGGLIGYLVFSHKLSGSPYNQSDVEVIDIIADEFAIALQNALQFQEIKNFNVELQEKIDEATAQLRSTNQKLHALDEAKDDFISMASHQLRTPLTSVKGYLSMVLDGDVGKISAEQQKVLEEAYTSSQRMVYLIGDFLNVSRIQTGKFELERSQTNLSYILSDEIDQLRTMASSRQVKIEFTPPAHFPNAFIDQDKFRQVMMNFIDNAIYYSYPNTTITILLFKEGGDLVFKVVDQGIGVPSGERHRLFTKFYRASNAKKQRPDGTGIGLFMAQKVVIAHSGSMIFESVEGKGSTFGFRLPLEQSKDNSKKLEK